MCTLYVIENQADYGSVDYYVELSIDPSLLQKCDNLWTYPTKIDLNLPQFQPVDFSVYENFTLQAELKIVNNATCIRSFVWVVLVMYFIDLDLVYESSEWNV